VTRLPHRTLGREDLAAVEPWFDDPATRRWLGGRAWPRRLVELAEQPARFALLWEEDGVPVALLDLEVDEAGTAAVALVVAPEARGRGIATAILASVFALAELAGVHRVIGEVERGNDESGALVRAAGFVPDPAGARDAGFRRWVLLRPRPPAAAGCA
jgi:RimJ/RimL family protein N-acetyltransferase